VRKHDAGHREENPHVVSGQPWSQPALRTEKQDEDQPGDHWRDCDGKIDQGNQQAAPGEAELGQRPGCRQAERQVQRDRDGGDQEGQPHRRQRVRVADAGPPDPESLAQRFGEHGGQGHHERQQEETKRQDPDGEVDEARGAESGMG